MPGGATGESGATAASNAATAVLFTAAAPPYRPALCDQRVMLTYAALDERSARLATLMRTLGIEPGERVGLVLPNSPAYAVAFLAALRAGAIAVPMNPMLRAAEVEHVVADSGLRLLLTSVAAAADRRESAEASGVRVLAIDDAGEDGSGAGTNAAAGRSIEPRLPDDTALLLYSSGTTGKPKGVELTHRNVATAATMTEQSLGGAMRGAIVITAAPVFHGFGLGCGLDASLVAGASVVLLDRFDADRALDCIASERAEIFLGVPTMFSRMVQALARRRRDLSSLRLCMSGGGPLRPDLLHATEEAFGCEVIEGYGISEAFRVAANRPGQRRPGAVGKPLPGVAVRVVGEGDRPVAPGAIGEILVRGPNVMKGYWRRPVDSDRALRAGWLHTGDLGRIEPDGAIVIAGREKEVIIRGGYNVFPREVEDALCAHPDVVRAAVYGVPDDEMGEEVAADVVLAPAASVRCDELKAWVRERIAPYKYPRRLRTVDSLPEGITGKVLRRRLSAAARERASSPSGG